eukprot:1858045-Prymnesium_polylepis.1
MLKLALGWRVGPILPHAKPHSSHLNTTWRPWSRFSSSLSAPSSHSGASGIGFRSAKGASASSR